MELNKILYRLCIGNLLLIISCGLFAAETQKLPYAHSTTSTDSVISARNDDQTKSYTLKQITAIDDISLKGVSPTFTFFLPIKNTENVSNITLNLFLSPSPLLSPDSNLTLLINDLPISTSKLAMGASGILHWDVKIPSELLTPGVLTIKLVAYLRITDKVCMDLYNPANWLNVSGNSTIVYQVSPSVRPLTLENFPAPFLLNQSFEPDHLVFSWPDEPNLQTLQAIMSMMNQFSQIKTWRGLDFEVIPEAKLQKITKPSPLVMIGTLSQLRLNDLKFNLPLNLVNNTQITDAFEEVIDEDTGILMVAKAPWNDQQNTLIVTGQTPVAVNKSLSEIHDLLNKQIKTNNDFILVKNTATSAVMKNPQTLKDYGYEDQVVYGMGSHHIAYQIYLEDYLPKNITLDLNYNYSAIFSPIDYSSLTLVVNGFPVQNVVLDKHDKPQTRWFIPTEVLHVGNNTLDFNYDLNIPHNYCERVDFPFLWGSIMSNSKVHIEYSDEMASNQVSQLDNLFSGNTIFALPNEPFFYTNPAFIQQLLELIKQNPQMHLIRVISTHEVNQSMIHQGNLVYLGSLSDNSWLKNKINFKDNSLIHKNEPYLVLMDVPFSTNKVFIISAQEKTTYSALLKNLNTAKISENMIGDTVLFNPNGSFISAKLISKTYLATIYLELRHNWLHYLVVSLAILAFLFSLAYFLNKKRSRNQ